MDYLEFVLRMQSIAKVGLKFNKDPYALENYKIIEEESKAILEKYTNSTFEEDNYYVRDLYPTPNVSTRVMVVEEGKILLVREIKSQDYSLPGGWCEVFETARKNAIDEVKQESGYEVALDRILGIFNRQDYQDVKSSISEYAIYFSAHIIGGKRSTSHETDDVNFFSIDELPPLSYKNTLEEIKTAYDIYLNNKEPYFD